MVGIEINGKFFCLIARRKVHASTGTCKYTFITDICEQNPPKMQGKTSIRRSVPKFEAPTFL